MRPVHNHHGLSAGVWVDQGSKIFKIVNNLRVGVVWANTYNKLPVRLMRGRIAGVGGGLPGGLSFARWFVPVKRLSL